MQDQIAKLQNEAAAAMDAADNLESLATAEKTFLGKKGPLAELMKTLKAAAPEEKREMGQAINVLKKDLEAKFAEKKRQLAHAELNQKLENDHIDVTAPGLKANYGGVHPISQLQEEVEQIFASMGFEIKDGPEVESEYFNFEGLNIPETHPARDMQDTFFVNGPRDDEHGRLVLRTHTSPVQVRTMQAEGYPLRIIVPGRVFRYEATDATHDSTFYQVEGLLIDKHITLAHLKGVMKEFLSRLFHTEVNVRFRPGYFPFVEPGLELDFSCVLCSGTGQQDGGNCKTCKGSGWIEFMGAGLVHPNVLRAGGLDPDEVQGWAFGFGLTRLVMMKYKIPDIRLLFGGDTRFLKQF